MIAHLTDQNAIMVRWSDDVCPNEAKTMIREHSLRRYDDDQRTWLDLASLPPVHPHSKHPRSPKEALAKTTPAMIEMMINMIMMMIWQNQPYDDHDVCALEVFPSLGPDFQPWGRKYLQTTLKVSLPSICKSRNNILLLATQTSCKGVQEANRCSTVGGRTVSKDKLLDSGDPVLWE